MKSIPLNKSSIEKISSTWCTTYLVQKSVSRIESVEMTKSELLAKLRSEHPDMSAKNIEAVVNTIFNTIIDAVANGRRVELRNFGTFATRRHKAKVGHNPRTGKLIEFQERAITSFRTGKLLFERINSKR